jgi:pyruvate-formate lyase-activating enzyme
MASVKKSIAAMMKRQPHRAISWTGGEPLLHPTFLAPMMAWAKSRGIENYLETNGTLPAALRAVAPLCDVVAMDVKLPSSTGRQTWALHKAFIKEVPKGTFVKVVLSSRSTLAEWRQVLDVLRAAPRRLPLILQPATRFGGVEPLPAHLCEQFKKLARPIARQVRIVPQWQHIWGVR